MYYPESATVYLHYPDGVHNSPIHIGRAFDKDALFTVQTGKLQKALDQAAAFAASKGKRPHLEIHCHGYPGALSLGDPLNVNRKNVQTFGASLTRFLRHGGLIEILACSVASQKPANPRMSVLRTEPHMIEGYRPDYHDVIRIRKTQRKKTWQNVYGQDMPRYGRGNMVPVRRIIDDEPGQRFSPDPEQDGMMFCLELAAATQCVVRAAVTEQGEEDESGESPIGNWENEIFDFHPDGKIVFVGNSPYRGPLLDSYDSDRFTA